MSQHRLAAIVFTDIVGYTELMQRSEYQAIDILDRYKQIIFEKVNEAKGNLIQFMGDGCLLLFDSASQALQFSLDVQTAFRTEPEIPVRIGVHVGDVLEREDQIYGDAVNLASRIESMGVPGSVLFSGQVYQSIQGQSQFLCTSLGEYALKHVSQLVEIFALSSHNLVVPNPSQMAGKGQPIAIDNTPSADEGRLRILIVEDDMIVGTHISMLLTEAGYELLGVIPSGEAAVEQIRTSPPDLVLMDVNLKGRMDGVETAHMIYKEFRLPVIFLTANSDPQTFSRAKAAFPFAFISKPFKPSDLLRAIELVVLRLAGEQIQSSASAEPQADQPIREPVVLEDRIFVRDKSRMVKVNLADIGYVEAERNYCNIHLSGRTYLLSVPLKTLEARLPDGMFVRVHRSFLVNITLIDAMDEHYVFVCDNAIPVSKSHKEALRERLNVM